MSTNSKAYNGSVTQAIKDKINIVDLVSRYVTLQRAGNRWVAPCPFHQETKPSFSVNEEEGFFYCFGCQAAGDLFEFYARINGLEFKEALGQLAEEAGVALDSARSDPEADKRKSLKKLALRGHDIARDHFKANLSGNNGKVCRDYLAKRSLDPSVIEKFELGWSLDSWDALSSTLIRAGFTKEQGEECGLLIKGQKGTVYDRFRARLMFPIKNMSGQTIAFGGRIIDNSDTAKYINSSDNPVYKKGDNLYGLFQARRSISVKKSILLTEGYMDVLTLHQFGYENSCGVLGTALTPEQIKRLSGLSSLLELVFDGDGAGRKAALRSCGMILSRGLSCKVILLPDGEDIDSLLKNQGQEAFDRLRASATNGLDFCIRTLNSNFAPVQIIDWVKDFLANIEVPEMLPRYVSDLSNGLGMDPSSISSIYQANKKNEPRERAHRGNFNRVNTPSDDTGYKDQTGRLGSHRKNNAVPISGKQKNELFGVVPDPDRAFLAFAIRNPMVRHVLQHEGLAFALSRPWAIKLWEKMLSSDTENDAFFLAELSAEEKLFWVKCKSVMAPPPDPEKDAIELEQVCASIKRILESKSFQAHQEALYLLKGEDEARILLHSITKKDDGNTEAE